MLLDLFFGDAKLKLDVEQHSPIKYFGNDTPHKNFMQEFEIRVPYKNIGSQELTILDTWARVYLPDEQYDKLHISARVNDSERLRNDDYFEAMLVPANKGGELVLRFTAIARDCTTDTDLQNLMKECPEFDVAVYAECRGRKEVYINKEILTVKLQ